jgi:1-acyl-sn-glycerol-3-phosphate acyltransferase
MPEPTQRTQLDLLHSRRFLPFFLTQFLGAFNDNAFKNALLVLIAFGTLALPGIDDNNVIINLAAGIFVLPFFLFSATAGQIADKFDKSRIMQLIKLAEVAIMMLALAGFTLGNAWILLGVLFLMGIHSAFFGPVKYAVLPQHLHADELVGGNAWVGAGTFLAILLGTITGGVLAGSAEYHGILPFVLVIVAVTGFCASTFIPKAPPATQNVKLNWNPVVETWRVMRHANQNRAVFLSIMGISWFWLVGSVYLTQLPNFTRINLSSDASVVTLLLALFSTGIGVGCLLCERMSGKKVELGLVPFGAMGLTFFGIDLHFAGEAFSAAQELHFSTFLVQPHAVRVMIDILAIGMFGGFYIVPLYAMVQQRTEADKRARVIAANNVLNALFMVASAGISAAMLGPAGLSIPQLFLAAALMNVAVIVFICQQIPEFTMRFMVWLLGHTMYRVRHIDLDNIPEEGAAVVVCNHVSFVDALLLAGASRRPLRFVMFKPIYDVPVLNFIFRTAGAVPITSKSVDPVVFAAAFEAVDKYLIEGEVVCIFPEGKLTTTGELNEFKAGIEHIIARRPVPVVPMALKGLWGSFFSNAEGKAMAKMPQRFWSRVTIAADKPVPPEQVTAELLQQRVQNLLNVIP